MSLLEHWEAFLIIGLKVFEEPEIEQAGLKGKLLLPFQEITKHIQPFFLLYLRQVVDT